MKPCWAALALTLVCLTGCVDPQVRSQAEEDSDHDRETAIQTIGDVTSVANVEPVPLSGVGLVVGLGGTGGPAPPSGFVDVLSTDLRKRGVEHIKELLSSPDHAVVLVSAMVPPGARKGEPVDIEITLPPQSKVKSLRGGVLLDCPLYDYASTRMLSPTTNTPDTVLKGHALANARGPLVVGFGDGDPAIQLRQARIWGGAKLEVDRPIWLALNSDQQFARVAMRIAERINETFQGPFQAPGTVMADAKTKEVVSLRVPTQYQHNMARYLRVVRLIPLQGSPLPNSPYRRHLENDLLDPSKTVVAALRLEALGDDSAPILKKGLQSQHPLVRFAAAEALAYLGNPSSAEELAQLAAEEPMLRAYTLTALASLGDEAVCNRELTELLNNPSPETRYGAFRALRVADEQDIAAQGEYLNKSFWLHRVAPGSPGLAHLSTNHCPEIVLFGDDPTLEPPFSFLAGPEFTLTAGEFDEVCMVSRFSAHKESKQKQCSLKLYEVLKTMAELGATYSDAAELLRQADHNKCLSCPVVVDALPDAPAIEQLAHARQTDGSLRTTDGEILNARSELTETPSLFQRMPAHHVEPVTGE